MTQPYPASSPNATGTRIKDVNGLSFFAMISAMNTMIMAKPKNARFIGFPPLASLYFYGNIIPSPKHSV